jgi:hypothetical protein
MDHANRLTVARAPETRRMKWRKNVFLLAPDLKVIGEGNFNAALEVLFESLLHNLQTGEL